ncbi:hypothetical protein FHS19_000752 [Paenibacillus rhizosphaerae]|uniref:HTH arsR-type domain-containing protein n=1 Tax=Paenibacillus rhizosphaerae TaxID=297318 RepID=A0A839TL19_9BACL|nr:ArsR family transcriptional regulator [Paenibacillus rhizosphaerae]MBB3126098.1 hypothetical protein [Paenibacillus rhizosphaerae]
MNLLDLSFKRTSYEATVQTSLWYECALGAAVLTYPKLHGSLDKPGEYYALLRQRASRRLEAELQYCQEHNTWKMLLQLLHSLSCETIDNFAQEIHALSREEFRYRVLPYLETALEPARRRTAEGDLAGAEEMMDACRGHRFFPQMIHDVVTIDADALRDHLITLLQLWYSEVMEGEREMTAAVLKRDAEEKMAWLRSLAPEEVVLRATGVEYAPEPGIQQVLLIPHVIYRPFTVEASLPQTKVFYYPVSDTSLPGLRDPYEPPARLVQIYKALGDDKRLRALKLIAGKDRTLKELTDALGLGKTTVHHHLAVLRAAGLIRVNGGSYAWNAQSLHHHERELNEFLSGSHDE